MQCYLPPPPSLFFSFLSQAARRELAASRVKDLSSLIEYLKELEELEREASRLEATLKDYERRLEMELPGLEAEIDELEATLLEAAETSPGRVARSKRRGAEERAGDRKKRRSGR